MFNRRSFTSYFFAFCMCGLSTNANAQGNTLYFNFVDTVFQAIEARDPSSFACLKDQGRGIRQVWDKRVNVEPNINAYVFHAHFTDGKITEIIINPEFGSQKAARKEALRYVLGIGQLPATLRANLNRFSVHKGREGFHAGTGQVVMYAEQATHRIKANHLEESIFHEAVHASWDATIGRSNKWKRAQQKDGRFLTRYGASAPAREDLAETALFTYALINGRIPPADASDMKAAVPNRIKYLTPLLAKRPKAPKKVPACS